jgi:hypothetical protein
MRVSLLWQAVLAFTNRIPPFPGLMQASSTPALVVVASFATGTAKTSRAIPAKLPTMLRLTDFVVICSPLVGAWAAIEIESWETLLGGKRLYRRGRDVSMNLWGSVFVCCQRRGPSVGGVQSAKGARCNSLGHGPGQQLEILKKPQSGEMIEA